jgi:ATP-dependent Clp protease adaptor protein ClpS
VWRRTKSKPTAAQTTPVAATSKPDPPPRDPGPFQNWIIDPLRFLWVGLTGKDAPIPTTPRPPQPQPAATNFSVPLSAEAEEVVRATAQAHDDACSWDLLLALLGDSDVQHVCNALGVDVEALRIDVRNATAALGPQGRRLCSSVQLVLRKATIHAIATQAVLVKPTALLAQLWSDEDNVHTVLDRHGLKAVRVKTFLSHGIADLSDWTNQSAPAGDVLAVVLVNDNYTTQEFVQYALQKIAALPEARALQLMLEVHMQGRGVISVVQRENAIDLANRIHDNARAAGFPLRAILERPADEH